MSPQELDPARRRAPRHQRSLLWRANTALAQPVARLFGTLGFTAGQLSLQSLTLTLVGLLRMASGEWPHVIQGSLIVYGGLLLDRADWLLAQAKPAPSWSTLLGLVVDRIVEAGLLVGLAVLAATGVAGVPGALDHPWAPLTPRWTLVLAAAALAAMLVARLAAAYADVLHLRAHLLITRRLPGPSAIPRGDQGAERVNRWVDRDLLVLAWVAGTMLVQVQLTLVVLLATQVASLGETLALFWRRRRDPEPQASRVLATSYP